MSSRPRPCAALRWTARLICSHWRRDGLWRCWRSGRGRRKRGRPRLDAQLVSLIEEMSRANCLWGSPRIHGELLKLGLKVSEATVAKYMVPRRLRRGPGWRVFLRSELAGLEETGLSVELKEAWDELKGLWAWRQWFSHASEIGMVRDAGRGSPVTASIVPGHAWALAGVDSRNIAGSELGEPFGILPVRGQARDPPARSLNSEKLRQQIGPSELVCEAGVYAERCAA